MYKLNGFVESENDGKLLIISITDINEDWLGTIKVKADRDGYGYIVNVNIDFAEHVYVNGHHWLDAEIKPRQS